ncbi:PEP-CTERM sorting domain-containing protein [Chlorogloea sp. CCALA 695]|uniref:PEP-CTERM sorting domain-containing protein n=1 Tax=Chlorogloea sp. CCALA 695 TaxID=2107693 RepID=UPI000D0664AC|nr:PEP-CTERM sorting domain-containing protein [Chlorogloea sp. CCALA 695]PSB34815.1 PEP-CTERM sorting domain-containing protein [Chlorogloea sp. CCALA 695]
MKLTNLIGCAVGGGVALISLATPSYAQTFVGDSSGTFGIPNSGTNSDAVFSGIGTDTFTFGDSVGTGPNEYSFAGNSFSTTLDSLFQVGDFTYYNGATFVGTTVDSVPLNISFDFTDPSGVTQAFSFNFQNDSTPNTGTAEENADFVFPINSIGSQTFTVGTTEYTLALSGFSQDGGVTTVEEFRVLEGESTTAGLFGKITTAPDSEPIPEPSSVLGILALSALGGGSLLKRKRQQMNKVKL